MVRDMAKHVTQVPIIHKLQQLAVHGFEARGEAIILEDKTTKLSRAAPVIIYGIQLTSMLQRIKGRKHHAGHLIDGELGLKKMKEPSKRFFAKSWTLEMQEAIREGRGRKALEREDDSKLFCSVEAGQ